MLLWPIQARGNVWGSAVEGLALRISCCPSQLMSRMIIGVEKTEVAAAAVAGAEALGVA
jgi:hypothetical protein